MSFYVQTYSAGSAVVIASPDLTTYYVFLDEDFSDGIDADEYGNKPYHLEMNFGSLMEDDSLERCFEAPVSGSLHQNPGSVRLTGTP